MATVKIDVAPSVLIWARESMGLSLEEAAKRIKMSPLDLRYLEEGVGDPTLAQVERMSGVPAPGDRLLFAGTPARR